VPDDDLPPLIEQQGLSEEQQRLLDERLRQHEGNPPDVEVVLVAMLRAAGSRSSHPSLPDVLLTVNRGTERNFEAEWSQARGIDQRFRYTSLRCQMA
jgi:hypothetical protein